MNNLEAYLRKNPNPEGREFLRFLDANPEAILEWYETMQAVLQEMQDMCPSRRVSCKLEEIKVVVKRLRK